MRIRLCVMVMVITNSVEYGQKLGVLSFNLRRAAGATKGKAGRLGTTGLPLEPACVWDIEALGVWELR